MHTHTHTRHMHIDMRTDAFVSSEVHVLHHVHGNQGARPAKPRKTVHGERSNLRLGDFQEFVDNSIRRR